jgi:hypothetical protein
MSDLLAISPIMVPFDHEHEAKTDAREMLHLIGAEVAGPLTSALERVNAWTSQTAFPDQDGLKALRDELLTAREAGMIAQQLARLGSGRLRLCPERMNLGSLLSDLIHQRQRENLSSGFVLKPPLHSVEVVADPSLLFNLLNQCLNWSQRQAQSEVTFSIEVIAQPSRVLWACQFVPRDQNALRQMEHHDSLMWRLMVQTLKVMQLEMHRQAVQGKTRLVIEFPIAASEAGTSPTHAEPTPLIEPSHHSTPLASHHVLVIASRREVRVKIKDALKDVGLMLDFVTSVEEAIDFCKEALPHGFIFESILRCESLRQLRQHMAQQSPHFMMIEILEEGTTHEVSTVGPQSVARVGKEAIQTALAEVLVHELSKRG